MGAPSAGPATRLRLIIEYDGAAYAGWQQQRRGPTVAGRLEEAFRALTGRVHHVLGAGRTDAGAHALGQVAAVDYVGAVPVDRLCRALNAVLPADIVVVDLEVAPAGFDPRRMARWRHYRYRCCDRPARPALERGRCWHLGRRLDVELMAEAAQDLRGEIDWTSLSSASTAYPSRVRPMRSVSVSRRGDMVEIDMIGAGFLRGMARGIAGALVEVGLGRREPAWVRTMVAARDRRGAPRTAPACGLFLVAVGYGPEPPEDSEVEPVSGKPVTLES